MGDGDTSIFLSKVGAGSLKLVIFSLIGILIVTGMVNAASQDLTPDYINKNVVINISKLDIISTGTNSDLDSITVDIIGTATVGNITNATLYNSTGALFGYNDTFDTVPFVIISIGTPWAPDNYTLMFTISANATDGVTIGANVTAVSGTNVSLAEPEGYFASNLSTIDITPPTITWISANNSWVNEDYHVIYFNVSDSGSGVNLSTISVTASNGSIIFSATSNCTGTTSEYSCNATWNTTGLSDYAGYTITVTANDSISTGGGPDNQNSSTITLNLDKTPPGVGIVSPQNTTYNYANILINVSVVDALSGVDTVIAEINGTDNVTLTRQGSSNYWNYSSYVFSDGSNVVRIYANDSASNLNSSVQVYFTVDTTPPTVNYVAPTPVNNANLSQDFVYINVSVSDATTAIDTCILEFNGTINYTMTFVNITADNKSGYCSYNVTGLNEAQHNFSVYVNDTAGNLNRTSLRYVTLDVTPPQVTINVPQNNANVSGTLNVNATVIDNLLAIDTVQFNLSNTTWSKLFVMARQAGTDYWNYTLDTTTIQDGVYNITIRANDTAGNVNYTEYVTVTVDNNAPVVTFVSPTPSSGTITNKTYVYINVTVQDVTTDSGLLEWNGTINYTMTKVGSTFWYNKTNLADGVYTYKVYVNDSFGNFNVSETRSITIDTAIVSITVGNVSTNAANNYTDNVTALNTVIIVNTGTTEVNGSITINEYIDVPVGVNPLTSAYGLEPFERAIKRYLNATPSDNLNATSGNVSWTIIRMYYTDADVSDLVESSLSLYWYNVTGGNWVKLTTGLNLTASGGPYVYEVGVDTANNYVWANLSHLSVYAISGEVSPFQAGEYYPEVTILANSIDGKLAEEFIDYLTDTGIDVYLTDNETFSNYNKKSYIIILGGPDAYEGVGEIVSQILTEEEKEKIRQEKAWIKKKNVFRNGQVVHILAGRDRNATVEVWREYKEDIRKIIQYNLN
jgi:hypothetical protein